jgi:SPP1 gp7 family putative phage head morphogenesis protein
MAVCRRIFDQQKAEVIGALESPSVQKNIDGVRGRKIKEIDPSKLFGFANFDEYAEELSKALKPLYFNVITSTGYSAMAELAFNGQQVPTFDPYKKNIQDWFNGKAEKVGGDVNAETEKQLRATLQEGISLNETNNELRARIEQVFGYASTRRADNIARTESARAQTYADIAAWQQSGVVIEKRWYTARDERVCRYCAYMDGTVEKVGVNFFNKGESLDVEYTGRNGETKTSTLNFGYDSIKGAPLHGSCRCVLIPILSKV